MCTPAQAEASRVLTILARDSFMAELKNECLACNRIFNDSDFDDYLTHEGLCIQRNTIKRFIVTPPHPRPYTDDLGVTRFIHWRIDFRVLQGGKRVLAYFCSDDGMASVWTEQRTPMLRLT